MTKSKLARYAAIYVGNPQEITCATMYEPIKQELYIDYYMTRTNFEARVATNFEIEEWARLGWFTIIEGNYIGTEEHLGLILPWLQKHNIYNVCYRTGDEAVGVALCDAGNYKQRPISLKRSLNSINAMRHFENLVNALQLKHEGNPLLAYQISMVEVNTKDDNTTISVSASGDNVCGAVAATMAVHGDFVEKEESSVNSKKGVMYFPKNMFK